MKSVQGELSYNKENLFKEGEDISISHSNKNKKSMK